jgi:hypothetical protein
MVNLLTVAGSNSVRATQDAVLSSVCHSTLFGAREVSNGVLAISVKGDLFKLPPRYSVRISETPNGVTIVLSRSLNPIMAWFFGFWFVFLVVWTIAMAVGAVARRWPMQELVEVFGPDVGLASLGGVFYVLTRLSNRRYDKELVKIIVTSVDANLLKPL